MAPRICAGMYEAIRSAWPVIRTEATVNAGFKWASVSPIEIATATPEKTASAQPAVMATHPAFSALDLPRRTPPTTPLPKRIKIAVPTNSPTTASLSVIDSWFTRCTAMPAYCIGRAGLLATVHLFQTRWRAAWPQSARLEYSLWHGERVPEFCAPVRLPRNGPFLRVRPRALRLCGTADSGACVPSSPPCLPRARTLWGDRL